MKILHLMKDYKPTIGGSVVRNGSMIDSYKKLYPQVQIIVINMEGKKYKSKSIEEGVTVYRTCGIWEMIQITCKIINENNIDIIQAHNFRFLYVAYIARTLARNTPKLFVEIHALYNMAWYKTLLAFYLLKRVDGIIVLAECAKQYLVNKRKINNEKIFVLRNGIETSVEKKKLTDQEFREKISELCKIYQTVLYTGSFFEWQGVNFLADNLKKILDAIPDIAFVMVGNGPEFSYVEKKIDELIDKERILLHCGVSKNEIFDLYDFCDIVIIPRLKNLSTNTAVPLKVIEPMELGKCIISADDDGLREVLNSDNATLFESGNVESLILALKKVVSEKKENLLKAQNAKKVVKELFVSWDDNAKIMDKLYRGE